MDCLELHKLTVFTAGAAERQRYYIQQGIRKPQRATVNQFVSRVEVLNGYLRYLPTLKNSPKAVATTKKGNVPFKEADLVSIMLAALPLTWQNQYNLTHSTVPKFPRALLADLEKIERVMLERYGKKCGRRTRLLQPVLKRESPVRARLKGARLFESRKRQKSKSSARSARLTAGPIRLTIRLSVVAGTKMVSPSDSMEVSHPRNISPTKRMEAKRGWRV